MHTRLTRKMHITKYEETFIDVVSRKEKMEMFGIFIR